MLTPSQNIRKYNIRVIRYTKSDFLNESFNSIIIINRTNNIAYFQNIPIANLATFQIIGNQDEICYQQFEIKCHPTTETQDACLLVILKTFVNG